MIKIRLKEAIDQLKQETGERVTYEQLAKETGLSKATIESIASRSQYNASLKVIDILCQTLRTTPQDLLEYISDSEEKKDSCEN
ncbi:MAG: helix-turn-helix domain-containing protein [Cellvibrionaceae bacterium]